MRAHEIFGESNINPETQAVLLKLHKGAAASLNAKKTEAVLKLLGWTMEKMAFIKPSDETREFENLTAVGRESLLARTNKETGMRLHVESFDEDIANALHAKVAKYVVDRLPDPKKAKSDDYFVTNLSQPEKGEIKDKYSSRGMVTRWLWSFDLFRKCTGYRITSPDGQTFDVCGPVQTLGFKGTKDFAAFYKWAVEHTDIEQSIADLLGMPKHVKASERPRVAVGGQVLGTCAICGHTQVVRGGKMVNHGYNRPGVGYLIGECFGVGHDPYEVSPNACKAYIPVLESMLDRSQKYLDRLVSGKVTQLTKMVRDRRTLQMTTVVVNKDEKEFGGLLSAAIRQTENDIQGIGKDIQTMQKMIRDWKPGVLRTAE